MLHALAAFNILLGLVGFGWLMHRTTVRRDEYPTEVLLLLYLAVALFAGLLSASVAAYVDRGTPYDVGVIFGVKVYALYVLWRTRHTKWRTGTRTAAGNPGADQNRDVA